MARHPEWLKPFGVVREIVQAISCPISGLLVYWYAFILQRGDAFLAFLEISVFVLAFIAFSMRAWSAYSIYKIAKQNTEDQIPPPTAC